jgi:hypothetical protein
MIALVHFQFTPDNGQMLEKILSTGKPFRASIPPVLLDKTLTNEGKPIFGRVHPEEANYFDSWFIDALKDNRKNPNMTIVQEGFLHYCEKCFQIYEANDRKAPDPYHEHICISDLSAQSLDKQLKAIRLGKELLMDKLALDVPPDDYCGANHLTNSNTLRALNKEGFHYLVTKNVVGLPIYGDKGIIVLPEAEVGSRLSVTSPVVYAYYDHMVEQEGVGDAFLKVLGNSSAVIESIRKPIIRGFFNQQAIFQSKIIRDLIAKTPSRH